jgi:hypothetical protein
VTGFHGPGDDLGGGERVPRGQHGVSLDGGTLVGTPEQLMALGSLLTLVYDRARSIEGMGPPPNIEVVKQAAEAALRSDGEEARRLLRQMTPVQLFRLSVAMRDLAGMAVAMVDAETRR